MYENLGEVVVSAIVIVHRKKWCSLQVVGTSRRQSRRSFLAGSEAAASGNKISLIDVSENGFRFGATNAWGFPLFLPDGLHFTKEGDDEFARLLADRLVGEGLVQ